MDSDQLVQAALHHARSIYAHYLALAERWHYDGLTDSVSEDVGDVHIPALRRALDEILSTLERAADR